MDGALQSQIKCLGVTEIKLFDFHRIFIVTVSETGIESRINRKALSGTTVMFDRMSRIEDWKTMNKKLTIQITNSR